MHLQRYLLVLCILAACCAQAAVIFKWTDAQGIVHYADQPVPGAQKILTNTDTMNTMHAPAVSEQSAPAGASAPTGVAYQVFAIASPTPEQSFVSEPVPVQLHLVPSLQSTHTLKWYLNGTLLDEHVNALQFTLGDLPRGAYTLVAKIVDPATDESASSSTVSFYVHQPSLLMPQHKKP